MVEVRTQPSPTSTPHLDRSLSAPTRFGRYVFAGEIGTGGMGVVYAAHDPELDRMVAVKLLRDGDARLQQRLRREAQVMARLAHPNVVAIHDVGTFEGRMFIAMEYVEGETLARWISRPHAQREILDVYCAAGRGLAAAHAAGIIHRDFKPDNVLIGHDGRVRVGDFGLACPAGTRPLLPSLPTLTAPGTLLGTRYYMAPELYKGVDADVRSDQFSFCVSLFTALYGERPYCGDTPSAPGSDARGSDASTGNLSAAAVSASDPRRIGASAADASATGASAAASAAAADSRRNGALAAAASAATDSRRNGAPASDSRRTAAPPPQPPPATPAALAHPPPTPAARGHPPPTPAPPAFAAA